MKSVRVILPLMIYLVIGILSPTQSCFSQETSVSVQIFYDELSPYGTWVNNPEYGYVWYPNAGAGFSPYQTNGYWLYTDYGWTWVSNYNWGWAPFHYGRWYHDPMYGPMWVPGYEWGPGWVTWRRSAGYYGWAPIGPGVTINAAYDNDYFVPHSHWRFVRDHDFGKRDINKYYVSTNQNITIINHSTVVINSRVDKGRNVAYNSGPERLEVEKHSGKRIVEVPVREGINPGQNIRNDHMEVYRPDVRKNQSSGANPSPAKVHDVKNVPLQGKPDANVQSQKGVQPKVQGVASPPQNKGQDKGTDPPSKVMKSQKPTTQAKPASNPGTNQPPQKVQPKSPQVPQQANPRQSQFSKPNQTHQPKPQQQIPVRQKESHQQSKPKH